MTVSHDPVSERRRFSSVLISHPDLRSITQMMKVLKQDVIEGEDIDLRTPHWKASSLGYLTSRSLYPIDVVTPDERLTDDGRYDHRCFVASGNIEIDGKRRPHFLLVSPYVRILSIWQSKLRTALGPPKPTFLSPHLDELFEHLTTESTAIAATRITMQMHGFPGVDKVALTGSSPLISNLRKTIEESVESSGGSSKRPSPYAARLEVPRSGHDLRLHLDRHGNYWWHQLNGPTFGVAVRAIAYLADKRLLQETHAVPLDRAEEE